MTAIHPFSILGTGEALPPQRIVTTEHVAKLCGVNPLDAISRSGVKERRWISGNESAISLGAEAAENALANANLEIKDIDILINASGTQVQAIPDGGALFASALGLTSSSFSVHATCISFLFALQQAALLIQTDNAQKILIISSEWGSCGLNFNQPESALLIGDGAAAIVIGKSQDTRVTGIQAARFLTSTEGVTAAEIRGYGSRFPISDGSASAEDFTFDMDGLRLLSQAIRTYPRFLERLRPALTRGAPGIDRIVPHQTSRAGMQLMSRYWGWEKMTVTLEKLGNTIAASIPIALHRTPILKGERILLVGTGAGTLYGGLVVQL